MEAFALYASGSEAHSAGTAPTYKLLFVAAAAALLNANIASAEVFLSLLAGSQSIDKRERLYRIDDTSSVLGVSAGVGFLDVWSARVTLRDYGDVEPEARVFPPLASPPLEMRTVDLLIGRDFSINSDWVATPQLGNRWISSTSYASTTNLEVSSLMYGGRVGYQLSERKQVGLYGLKSNYSHTEFGVFVEWTW